jgi:DNA repair protein SbcD/Mre11
MRLIHTADWHLGRLFHGRRLTGDQAVVLEKLIELVAEVRPAVVLVAGDLYDRAVPPIEAVELLDHVLSEIVLGLGVPVVAIAGNHDSAERIGFGAALYRERGLLVAGQLSPAAEPLVLQDEHGRLAIHSVPYAAPAEARYRYADDSIHDHAAALEASVSRARAATPAGVRSVLVAHAYVSGAETSESERPLSLGGAGEVPASMFAGFDYVALGHLHRSQPAGDQRVRYAGSLLKYSFAEHDQRKSVTVVEVGAPQPDGLAALSVEQTELAAPHNVRRVEGTLAEILERGRTDPGRDDYVLACLSDRGALLDPLSRLREVYPWTMKVERPEADRDAAGRGTRPDPRRAGEAELFADFFRYVTNDDPSEAERAAFAEIVDKLRGVDQETSG